MVVYAPVSTVCPVQIKIYEHPCPLQAWISHPLITPNHCRIWVNISHLSLKFVNASLSGVVFRYCQLIYSYTVTTVRPYVWSVLLSTTVIQLFIKCSRSVFDFSHPYSNFWEHCYFDHTCLQNDVLWCPWMSSTFCCTVSWTSARVGSNTFDMSW